MNFAPVVITRRLRARPERVFAAWTQPEALKEWFAPGGGANVVDFELDARDGGGYRIGMLLDGDRFCVFGTYLRFEPPSLLQFTWQWEESSIEKGVSEVTVCFRELGGETELTISHAKLASKASEEAHTQGWNPVLGRLEEFLSRIQP